MRRFLALATCVLLVSCGNQTVAGGGSDQPNTLNAMVLRESGEPAAGAVARWVSGRWNPEDTSSTIDSVLYGPEFVFDASGRAQIERPDSGQWHLEVIDSIGRQVAVLDSLRGEIIRLLPAGEWSGYLASKGVVPSHIFLAGTSRSAVIGPDRLFHLKWLPEGQFRVLGRWQKVNRELATRYLDVGQSIVDDTLDGDSAEVELMDLDRRPLRCALRGVFWDDTVAGKWFSAYDVSSRVSPYDFAANPLSALKTDAGRSFLRVTYRFGNGVVINSLYTKPWAAIGVGTAPDARGLDWTGVTAIRFLARGRGVVRIQVNTAAIDSVRSEDHFGAVVSLDDTWRWFEVTVRELWSNNTAGISWVGASKGVHAVAFYAQQTDVQMDLADLRVRGSIEARATP